MTDALVLVLIIGAPAALAALWACVKNASAPRWLIRACDRIDAVTARIERWVNEQRKDC